MLGRIKLLIDRLKTGEAVSGLLPGKEEKRLLAIPRFQPCETTLFGKRFKIADSPTFVSSLKEIFETEIYRFETKDDPIVIIDCGANIGLATLYFKRRFPKAEIVAFEPDPHIFKVMEHNIKMFDDRGIRLRNEAISNASGVVRFHPEGGHSGMIVGNNNDTRAIDIKATRLKDILNQYSQVTFLKIDIEGHEAEVIPDIATELKRVRFLFLEYHSFLDSRQKLDEILAIISNAGFRYYLREAYDKKFPFIEREIFLNMDFLVNIFCYKD